MTETLLAPSWWMLAAGVVVAGVLFFIGNARLDNRLRWASAAVVAGVIAWWAVAYAVETPTEAARGGTKRLVAAVVARDSETLLDLLAPAATLGAFNREEIARSAPLYADEVGLASAFILASEIDVRGSQVVNTVRVVSRHEGGRLRGPDTMTTDWQFVWGRQPDSAGGGWKVVQITPVRIGTQDVGGVIGRFFTRPPVRSPQG